MCLCNHGKNEQQRQNEQEGNSESRLQDSVLPFEILEAPSSERKISKSLGNLLIVYSIRKLTARMPAIKDVDITAESFLEFHFGKTNFPQRRKGAKR